MAESSEDLKREFEEFEQAESSVDSGLESAPTRDRMPPWIKWVIIADLLIVAVVAVVVFAG
ncbi:MAG: hypothetical protein KDB52_02085 [Solirubrobacterales bacterium]|nr:hypothetical protein [Solirubrobacterales bacterium]